jgi:hypothetical protein
MGPFDTHAQALAALPGAKTRAMAADHWAHFYSYGTARVHAGPLPRAIFDTPVR